MCRFGYPKNVTPITTMNYDDKGEPTIKTKRNDPVINSHNVDQLRLCRTNCDMQLVVSKDKIVRYTAKYAAKAETVSLA